MPKSLPASPFDIRFVRSDAGLVDQLDEIDRQYVYSQIRWYWNMRLPTPLAGDFVRHPANATITRRLGRVSGESFQFAIGGAFHLKGGALDYGGNLHRSAPLDLLVPADDLAFGDAWFFHHGLLARAPAITVRIPRRVWDYDSRSFA